MALYSCHGFGKNQLFILKEHGQICQGHGCAQPNKNGVKMDSMMPAGLDGEWSYDEVGIGILFLGFVRALPNNKNTES